MYIVVLSAETAKPREQLLGVSARLGRGPGHRQGDDHQAASEKKEGLGHGIRSAHRPAKDLIIAPGVRGDGDE